MDKNFLPEWEKELEYFEEKFKSIGWVREDGTFRKTTHFITYPESKDEKWKYSIPLFISPEFLSYSRKGQGDVLKIWAKVSVSMAYLYANNTTIQNYSTPCRTRVKAPTFAEAHEKIERFAQSKTKTVICTEQEYKDSGIDVGEIMRQANGYSESLNRTMQAMADMLKRKGGGIPTGTKFDYGNKASKN